MEEGNYIDLQCLTTCVSSRHSGKCEFKTSFSLLGLIFLEFCFEELWRAINVWLCAVLCLMYYIMWHLELWLGYDVTAGQARKSIFFLEKYPDKCFLLVNVLT